VLFPNSFNIADRIDIAHVMVNLRVYRDEMKQKGFKKFHKN